MTPSPGPTTQDSGHTALLHIAYMQTFNLLHRGQNILNSGIVDIGIEYCGTVCSQHHTVWEDPRGSRRRFERIQRVGVQDMCSRVELI